MLVQFIIIKREMCNVCENVFHRKCSLRKHLIQIQKKKKVKCDRCNNMFTTSRNLDNPQKMHNERRAHECNIRDKAVKRKGGLRLHQRNIRRRKIIWL